MFSMSLSFKAQVIVHRRRHESFVKKSSSANLCFIEDQLILFVLAVIKTAVFRLFTANYLNAIRYNSDLFWNLMNY